MNATLQLFLSLKGAIQMLPDKDKPLYDNGFIACTGGMHPCVFLPSSAPPLEDRVCDAAAANS